MIICADDFGMAPDINEAITELARLQRISAVSVMAALPGLDRSSLAPLLALEKKIDLGLHLVFTSANALADGGRLPSFGQLMMDCWLGRFPLELAQKEIAAQYDVFTSLAGRAPDFIDGHMHVQQFPVIRQALVAFIRAMDGEKPYVRNSHVPFGRIASIGVSPLKTLSISLPGGWMKRTLIGCGIDTNDGFAGIYDFSQSDHYPEYLTRFTAGPVANSMLLMTHPGKEEKWRLAEYEALLNAEWITALATRFPRPIQERS